MFKLLFGMLAALAMVAGCARQRTQEVEVDRDTSMERREPEPSRDVPGGRLPEEGVRGTPMAPAGSPTADDVGGAREDQYGPPPAETTTGERSLGEPPQGEQSQQGQPQQNQPAGQQ